MSILTQAQLLSHAAKLDATRLVVLPVVAEDDGKAPMVKGWQKISLSKARFEVLMASNGSTNCFVRLDQMAMLDFG